MNSTKNRVAILFLFIMFFSFVSTAQVNVSTGGAPVTYTTLSEAFAAIVAGTHTGNILVAVTGNTTETATAALTASGTGTANYTSIKIMPTVSATISGSVAGPIINLNGADNVTIDGRVNGIGNQIGLVIQNTSVATSAQTIQFIESATNNIIQFCNIINAGAAIASGPRPINFSTSTIPEGNSNNQIISCIIEGGRIAVQLNGTTANTNKNNVIRKCIVKNWGNLGINFSTATENATADSCEVFFDNPAIATFTSLSGIVVSTTGGGIINITNNKVYNFQTTAANFAVRGINITPMAGAVVNIHNNFVSFTLNSELATSIYAISVTGALNFTANVYYNTTRLGGVGTHPTLAAGTIASSGIVRANSTGTTSVYNQKNNICINERSGGVAGIIHSGGFTLNPNVGTIDINHNLYFATDATNGAHAGWNAGYNNLDTLKFYAAPHEANSIFKSVNFVSNLDLHITGASLGDMALAAIPIAGITRDIDGDLRSTTFPYKGADEAPTPIPVELSSFAAKAVGNSVKLDWTTATEINNKGFDIERKSIDGSFEKIAFLSGKGSTTEISKYSYIDNNLSVGNYIYRLKQIDFDGSANYSNEIQLDILSPIDFGLAQNYPNPFNPSTRIEFSLATDAKTSLKIYNSLGQEVMTLLNQDMSAGLHQVDFNASSLSTGVYLYKIIAVGIDGTNNSSVKKMMLMK